jgi:hypothetical protein
VPARPRYAGALAQSPWFVHGTLGVSAWEATRFEGPSSEYQRYAAVTPGVAFGIGHRLGLTRVLSVRAKLLAVAGTSNSGSAVGAFLDGSLRIGPVARAFPWFVGFGPFVGVGWFRGEGSSGQEENLSVFGLGGLFETGFAFGANANIELGLEAHLSVMPGSSSVVMAFAGLGLAIGL